MGGFEKEDRSEILENKKNDNNIAEDLTEDEKDK